MLARYGIRATRERPVGSAREAVMAAREIGWPVALKGFGPDIVHKSDEGAVALALGDETQLQTAWDLMARRLGTRLRGALVAEMARGEAEAILGIQHDRQFGPVVLVGLGGILAELIDDVVLIPAPVSPERVRALLPRLRLWPLLQGVRGGPALDVEALADAASRLSWLAVDAGAHLAELDINPLFLRRSGEGVIAVDARARLEA